MSNSFGGTEVSQYDYRYDAIGRRTDVVTTGTAFGGTGNEELSIWNYNDRNEVIGSNRHAGTNPEAPGAEAVAERRDYDYDPIGNRETALDQDGVTSISYTPNELNQYEAVGQQAPTYDDEGNLLDDGSGRTLTYNGENRLVAFDDGSGTTASYVYDYIGRRVRKVVGTETTTFVYDGWNQIREITDDGSTTSTKHNVWGLDLSQSMQGAGGIGGLVAVVDSGTGEVGLFAFDGNGNVSEVIDSGTGQAVAHYEYDAFGNVVVAAGSEAQSNPWQFSTKYLDQESGYSYYGYRYYDTELGRWVNRDPAQEEGGANLYAFVRNRAATEVDGLGLFGIDLKFSAFIPLSKGRPVFGAPGPAVNYAREPNPVTGFLWRWFFGTDDREVASWDGSSRVRSLTRTPIDSTKLGRLDTHVTYFDTTAGDSHRIQAVESGGALLYAGSYVARRTNVTFSEKVENFGCSSEINVKASGDYPFDPLAPNIDYSVTWLLTRLADKKVLVGVSGIRDNFPAYEAIIKDRGTVYEWYPPDPGPDGLNLNIPSTFNGGTVELSR